MKKILIIVLIIMAGNAHAQTGLLLQRYYITGSLSIGQDGRTFADSSAWLQVGNDTTNKGILLPKVVLDSVSTNARGLYVYDLKDSVLFHFDGNKKVRYMTYKDTALIKQIIAANPPDLSPYFADGGNTFGKTAVLGTTDSNDIDIITNDTVAVSINTKGVWTKQGRTNSISGIPLSIGTGYELYGITHASEGYLTYISGWGGDFSSNYNLVFGKPTNKILKISNNQIELNQNTVLSSGKTLQLGNLLSYESTPYTGFKYSSINGWHFSIKGTDDLHKLTVMSNGNVLVNGNTDDGYKLSVDGTTRVTDEVYIEKALTFNNNLQGIQIIHGSSGLYFPSILIGKDNGSYPTTGSRHVKIGTSNSSNPGRSFQYILGTGNNLFAAGQYTTCIGTFNNILTEESNQTIIGDNNNINYVTSTTSRGQFVIGSTNSVLHSYSSIIGNYQQTTGNNQLIIADGNTNAASGGYRQVFFGSGPKSTLQGGNGAPVTINASGANGTDRPGGLLRLAAGKSTGSATPPDLVLATATTLTSGSTQQTLTDWWYIKGQSGRLSNNNSPTALLDLAGASGYNQLRLRAPYTPTSTADANGNIGDLAWDGDYIYVKTVTGWRRTALSDF